MGATADQVIAQVTPLAGENEAVVGSNNTTVNKYFGVRGVAYCGYTLMYACRKAGSDVLNGCSNAAFVPTLKTYLKNKGWQVSNSSAQKGDIFVYTVPGGTGTHTGLRESDTRNGILILHSLFIVLLILEVPPVVEAVVGVDPLLSHSM